MQFFPDGRRLQHVLNLVSCSHLHVEQLMDASYQDVYMYCSYYCWLIMEHFELASVSFADGLISMHIMFPCLVAIREILSHACWEPD